MTSHELFNLLELRVSVNQRQNGEIAVLIAGLVVVEEDTLVTLRLEGDLDVKLEIGVR